MYQDIKRVYWWPTMKKDVGDFVTMYTIDHKVKAEY